MSLDISVLLDEMHRYWNKIKSMDKTLELEQKVYILEQKILIKDWNTDADELKVLNQELSSIQKEIQEFRSIEKQVQDIGELWALLKVEKDVNLLEELEQDIIKVQKLLEERELTLLLDGEFDISSCYLSINAGAGGTESNDWAWMLMRMYVRWAEKRNFTINIVDELPGEEVGIKNITIFIQGLYAYGYLKGEQGVHRLVRISPFDANKKRHTSFASVSIYPEIKDDIEVPISSSDLRIDTFRASGAGGQHVNKTESAIRIVHIPTGITVSCQEERSQHKNRDRAMNMLKSKLYSFYSVQKASELEHLTADKKDIAWGNQIRSYIFQPYKLIKDNRTNFEIGNVDKVMDGDIDPLLFEFLKWQYTK